MSASPPTRSARPRRWMLSAGLAVVTGALAGGGTHAIGARIVATRLGGGPIGATVDLLGIQLAVVGVVLALALFVGAAVVLLGPRPWLFLGSLAGRRRIARGRCHACGYLRVGAGTECPECGRQNWISAAASASASTSTSGDPDGPLAAMGARFARAAGGWAPALVLAGWMLAATGLHVAMEADERAFLAEVADAQAKGLRSVQRPRRTPPFGVFIWRVGGEPRNDW